MNTKRNTLNWKRLIRLGILIPALSLIFTGCEDSRDEMEDAAEESVDAVDEAAEEAADAVEDAADEVEDTY